jgi:LysM repeat protein
MKLPRIPKMFLARRKKTQPPQPPQKLQARTQAADPSYADGYDDEEPQTKLTSAFVVVLILHVVAVGGIYAFNQIKASRRPIEPLAQQQTATKSTTSTSQQGEKVEATQPQQVTASPQSGSVTPVSRQRVYNVKGGDTLAGIAKVFNVSVADLKTANGLTSDVIRPGQILNLTPAKTESAPAPRQPEATDTKPATRTYTVKSGDRLIFIAKKFSVSPEDLIAANKIKDPTKLQIGQVLKVPVKR